MAEVLAGVYPPLAAKMVLVYAAMAALGYPMRATEGLRTLARQKQLYAQGRTTPGKVVTKADGVNNRSNHQARNGETFGRAIDSCFKGKDPYLEKDPSGGRIWAAFGACVEVTGVRWGGRFPSPDRPHAEWL